MKILLIGEYSRLHNSLKEGLQELGHEVLIVGNGDRFKKFPVDISLGANQSKKGSSLLNKVLFKSLGVDLNSQKIKVEYNRQKHLFVDYDVVQLINEAPFNSIPKIESKLLSHIFKNNKNVFLLSCGADYISVNFAAEDRFKYSILNPYKESRASKKSYWHIIKFLTPSYQKLHHFVYKNIKGVIASDLDYHLPLLNNKQYLCLIPNPININKISFIKPKIEDRIIIFMGINRANYLKKGSNFFDEALEIISKKYDNKVSIIKTENLPYDEYIQSYNKAHIILDQVYAYDQGYNALEAMAKGKVVFTGAEQEWLDYYGLKEDTVAINALPNSNQIANKLSWLIENSEKIIEISENARAFIEKEHNYLNITKRYLEIWQNHSKN
ncbi:glycosyltransferase [Hanstruepera ponticola]|uniref:glycosyltransferase n=1 Tax=Hanstruepera ponticola TaxID=2042995 RepID=UPI00178451D6|nr:glycosyltransferase [Hanstruepera ponticola]